MSEGLFWLFAAAAIFAGWRVFRADSMVRAAYWLMASFVAVGGILMLLRTEFLGLVLILMMAGEMTIMAVFMVMFMMNPAGLNPMAMVHQRRTATIAAATAFAALASVPFLTSFPALPPPDGTRATAELGRELLGDSMLLFEAAGVALLSTMVGAIALASARGRFGSAEEGSAEPVWRPGADTAADRTRQDGAPGGGPP